MPILLRQVWFWILWPGLFIYLLGSKRSRVLLLSDTNEALLIQDNPIVFFDKTSWTIPGGGIRRRETPAAGAVRELSEELGIVISPESLRLLKVIRTGQYGLRYQAYFFVATVPWDITIQLNRFEVAAAAWMPLDDPQILRGKLELRQAMQFLAED